MSGKRLTAFVAFATLALGACTDERTAPALPERPITIADVTGLDRDRAVQLMRNLDLEITFEEIRRAGAGPRTQRASSNVVLRQEPAPGTTVPPGSTLVLYVAPPRDLPSDEQPFRLLTHCGLSYPLTYQGSSWLPVERKWRRTINAPRGFGSNNYFDHGTIRRIDSDTLVYTSSTGIRVEYEPTQETRDGCD